MPQISGSPDQHIMGLIVDIIKAYASGNIQEGNTYLAELRRAYPPLMQRINPTLKKLVRQIIKDVTVAPGAETLPEGPSLSAELNAAVRNVKEKRTEKIVEELDGTLDDLKDI